MYFVATVVNSTNLSQKFDQPLVILTFLFYFI